MPYYDFDNDPSLRAAVFFGHGENFSRGIDVDAFAPLARTGKPFAVTGGMLDPRVYGECLKIVTFPASPRIWSVADVGEPGRIASTESEEHLYREEAYQEIVKNVGRLVSDIW